MCDDMSLDVFETMVKRADTNVDMAEMICRVAEGLAGRLVELANKPAEGGAVPKPSWVSTNQVMKDCGTDGAVDEDAVAEFGNGFRYLQLYSAPPLLDGDGESHQPAYELMFTEDRVWVWSYQKRCVVARVPYNHVPLLIWNWHADAKARFYFHSTLEFYPV